MAAIFSFVRAGDAAGLAEAIQKGAKVFERNERFQTALHIASDATIASLLISLKAGFFLPPFPPPFFVILLADVHAVDNAGMTPLLYGHFSLLVQAVC